MSGGAGFPAHTGGQRFICESFSSFDVAARLVAPLGLLRTSARISRMAARFEDAIVPV